MQVRDYVASDEDAVVALGLRAWAPVFASMRAQLGDTVFDALYTDWSSDQDRAIREVLGDDDITSWVATRGDDRPIGFASARVDRESRIGEIVMLAVDLGAQRAGVGLCLTDAALAWMRTHGARVAMVETGGDPGHTPARATYAKARFTLMPVARYFQVL